jgi:hypothetical protein
MMSEVGWAWRGLPVVVGVFLLVGLCIGLFIGGVLWPPQIANVDVADLKPSAQDEFIILVADAYAYDGDLPSAQKRLAELKDKNIAARVARLAKELAAQNHPSATNLAVLALALGVSDAQIARLVMTLAPAATLTPTATPTAAPTDTPTPTLTPSVTPTFKPTSTITPTRTATRRPTLSPTPKPAALAPTVWLPAFPAEWPGGVRYEPANVAPGQRYWRLARALYCDIRDTRFDCPNLPGGSDGIGIYVLLVNGKAPLLLDGAPANLEDKSNDPYCQCTYELFPDGRTIQVANFPSDKIGGLALNSVKTKVPQTHVRYFLTFELVTR